jgi:hypothetical protein
LPDDVAPQGFGRHDRAAIGSDPPERRYQVPNVTHSLSMPVLTNGASLFIKKINNLATEIFTGTAKIPENSVEGRFLCFRKPLISLEVN